MNARALVAETLGTFAILLAFFSVGLFTTTAGGSMLAPAMAIGLATIALTYALGQVSGGHFNPAITVGLVAGGRFDLGQAPWYIVAQLLGAGLAAGFALLLALGSPAPVPNGFPSLANQINMTGMITIVAGLACEFVLTAILVIIFMGATAHTTLTPLSPIAIGVYIGLAYIIAGPITNAGLNPARSTATAFAAGAEHIAVLWMFWIVPFMGACAGGFAIRYLYSED